MDTRDANLSSEHKILHFRRLLSKWFFLQKWYPKNPDFRNVHKNPPVAGLCNIVFGIAQCHGASATVSRPRGKQVQSLDTVCQKHKTSERKFFWRFQTSIGCFFDKKKLKIFFTVDNHANSTWSILGGSTCPFQEGISLKTLPKGETSNAFFFWKKRGFWAN